VLADTLIARALICAGIVPAGPAWSYGEKATRADYLDICYPGDAGPDAQDMGSKQSACMLFVRGLLAHDEVDGTIDYHGRTVDILRAPYKDYLGQIEGMMEAFARARGLYRNDQESLADLEPGDFVVIGYGGSAPVDATARAAWEKTWGGLAHGLLVTGNEGGMISSVDGGQSDMRNGGASTAIAARVRRMDRWSNGWWLKDPMSGRSRRLNWRMRCADLPLLGSA
jgi:hypothetical protein